MNGIVVNDLSGSSLYDAEQNSLVSMVRLATMSEVCSK